MKKSLVLVAIAGLAVASGLQAEKHERKRCEITIVNDLQTPVIIVDKNDEFSESRTIAPGASANIIPGKDFARRDWHIFNNTLLIYIVDPNTGTGNLAYKLFEKRCSENNAPKELKMSYITGDLIKEPTRRFSVIEVQAGRMGSRHPHHHYHGYHRAHYHHNHPHRYSADMDVDAGV